MRLTGYYTAKPTGLIIEPTNYCTRACPICGTVGQSLSRTQGYMAWNIFKRVIDQASEFRPDLVFLFAHGESTMHPRIVDMVSEFSKIGINTEITTNGDLLTPDLVKKLSDVGLTKLTISHPGATPENYKRCRGEAFDAEKETRLFEALKAWEGDDASLSIRSLVIPKILYHRIDSISEFLRRLFSIPTVNRVDFHGYMPWPKHFCPDLLSRVYERHWRCELSMENITVFWDGSVSPCSYDVNGDLVIGNVKNRTLSELFNCKVLRNMRKAWFKSYHNWPELCKGCLINRYASTTVHVFKKEINAIEKQRALFDPSQMVKMLDGEVTWKNEDLLFKLLRSALKDIDGNQAHVTH